MGIKNIRLGKRSRVLEEQERKACEEAERAFDQAVAVHPPLPGPANPVGLRGCGCGRWHVPPGADGVVVADGPQPVEHRYSKPCPMVGGGELPRRQTPAEVASENLSLRDELRRVTERNEFLEAVAAVRDAPRDPLDPLPPPVAGQDPHAAGHELCGDGGRHVWVCEVCGVGKAVCS